MKYMSTATLSLALLVASAQGQTRSLPTDVCECVKTLTCLASPDMMPDQLRELCDCAAAGETSMDPESLDQALMQAHDLLRACQDLTNQEYDSMMNCLADYDSEVNPDRSGCSSCNSCNSCKPKDCNSCNPCKPCAKPCGSCNTGCNTCNRMIEVSKGCGCNDCKPCNSCNTCTSCNKPCGCTTKAVDCETKCGCNKPKPVVVKETVVKSGSSCNSCNSCNKPKDCNTCNQKPCGCGCK